MLIIMSTMSLWAPFCWLVYSHVQSMGSCSWDESICRWLEWSSLMQASYLKLGESGKIGPGIVEVGRAWASQQASGCNHRQPGAIGSHTKSNNIAAVCVFIEAFHCAHTSGWGVLQLKLYKACSPTKGLLFWWLTASPNHEPRLSTWTYESEREGT